MKEIEIETRNFFESDLSYDFGFGKMFYVKKNKTKQNKNSSKIENDLKQMNLTLSQISG